MIDVNSFVASQIGEPTKQNKKRMKKGRFKKKFRGFVDRVKNFDVKGNLMNAQGSYNDFVRNIGQKADDLPQFQLYNQNVKNTGIVIAIIAILVIFGKKLFK